MGCNLEEKGPELVVLAWEMLGIAEVVLQWECIIIKVRECAYIFVLCTVIPRFSPYIYGGLHSYFQGRQSTTTQATQMTNASSFDFEPYCIDANARTMAEFAAAMMRAIAEISVDNYGLSLHSLSSGASKTRYLKIC